MATFQVPLKCEYVPRRDAASMPDNGWFRIGNPGASILLTLSAWGVVYFRRLAPARTCLLAFPLTPILIGYSRTRPPSSRNFLSRCLDPLSPYKPDEWLVCSFSALEQLRHWRQDAASPPVPCPLSLPLPSHPGISLSSLFLSPPSSTLALPHSSLFFLPSSRALIFYREKSNWAWRLIPFRLVSQPLPPTLLTLCHADNNRAEPSSSGCE